MEPISETASEFATIEPKILYFGTPVAIVSSMNEDGSANLAPISGWGRNWARRSGQKCEDWNPGAC